MEIMDALWEMGSGSIREIHENLPEKRRPAYTTVQTIIRRLEEKGAVRQTKQVGNAHIFEPAITREAAHRRLIDDLLDLFGGSARPLMTHLAEAGKLTLEDVKELESLLSDHEERYLDQRSASQKLAEQGPKEANKHAGGRRLRKS